MSTRLGRDMLCNTIQFLAWHSGDNIIYFFLLRKLSHVSVNVRSTFRNFSFVISNSVVLALVFILEILIYISR